MLDVDGGEVGGGRARKEIGRPARRRIVVKLRTCCKEKKKDGCERTILFMWWWCAERVPARACTRLPNVHSSGVIEPSDGSSVQ